MTREPAPRRTDQELRRWSDALAGAGLFTLALQVLPAAAAVDDPALFRRAELAVLAGDHATALRLLKELDGAREQPDPAVTFMLAVARAQAGEAGGWEGVKEQARRIAESPWTSWLVALAAAASGELDAAGPAAQLAMAGGVRDLRLIVAAAAASLVVGDELTVETCRAAVDNLERARRVALADENPILDTLELVARAGRRQRAATVTEYAVEARALSVEARATWHRAGKAYGARTRRPRGEGASWGRRKAREGGSLTCRCWGSAGWVGPDRLHYVQHHLVEVDPTPVPDLPARLLLCRATRLRFLDFPGEQLTLPVDVATA